MLLADRSATSCRGSKRSRYVKDAGRNGRSAAHLRYIQQRDGISRDGERGQLYSASEDPADGEAFVERGKDRHQFRFIISPENGADLVDLTAHTRDLMSQFEADPETAPLRRAGLGYAHIRQISGNK